MMAEPQDRPPIGRAAAPPPRERILAAARELFYRRGIHAVGVDAIAEAAGTNKMTLYRHFASKGCAGRRVFTLSSRRNSMLPGMRSPRPTQAIRKASSWPGSTMSVTSRRTRPSAAVR